MNAGFNARGYERSAYAMVLLLALVGSIVSLPAAVRASGLECPTIATGSLSIASDSQITRMTTGNDADLANEIDGLIGRARAEAPRASIAETANLLIAAYCPVVAQMTTSSTQLVDRSILKCGSVRPHVRTPLSGSRAQANNRCLPLGNKPSPTAPNSQRLG